MSLPGHNYATPSSDGPHMSSPTPPAYPTYVPAPPQATTQKSAPSLRELLQAEPLKNATRPHSAINTHALMSVESQKRKQDEALYSSKDAGNKRPRQDVTNMPRKAMPQLARQQYHRWAQSSAHVPPNISYAHSPPISAFEYPHLPGAEQYRQQQFGPALDLGAHGSRTSPSHPGREENRQKQPGPTPVARGTRDDPLDLDSMPDTYNLLPQAQITNSYVQDHTPPTSLPNRYVKVCNNALPQQEGGVKLNAAEYKIAEKRAAYQPPADIGRESSGLCAIRDGWQGKVSIPDGWHGTIPDKYYAVLHGRDPGLYTTFEEAVDATMGHPGPQVMACASLQEVSEWMDIPPHDRKMKPSSSHEYRLHKSLPSQRPHEARPFAVPAELLEKVPSFETRVTGTAIPFEDENRLQATLPISTAYPPSPPPSYTAATITAPTDIVPIVEPDLCPEQADLVDIILSGRNVFYTGSAGCGKSTVLKAFVKRFNAIGKKVNIVAPTGRAALDINGSTTWTYAGWTPDHHKRPLKDLKTAAHGKFVRARMKDTDVLVIDEISMVENLHLERLNAIMKEARECADAFGGVQIIVTGDFCQLPPVKPFKHCITCGGELIVKKEADEYKCRIHGMYFDRDKWAFRSGAWEECDFKHVNLTTIHRQSDKVFIDILNKLRTGIPLTIEDRNLLLKHDHHTRNAIMLFPTRAEVKRVNDEMFNKLRSSPHTYFCLDHFTWNEDHQHLQSKHQLTHDGRSLVALSDHRYESQIQLKKGMLVVLLHNLDLPPGLVNGSQGTIQGFEDYDPTKLPKSNTNGRGRAGSEEPAGSGSLVGDYASFREQQIKAFINRAEFKKWPIVTFLNGVTRTIFADCTVNELGDKAPYSLLSRTQIPLMAAWAMTTHKSQGMTLNRVRVDLGRAFEEGQAYVALSRARSLEGLEVISLPPQGRLQGGNPQVKEFLKQKFGI